MVYIRMYKLVRTYIKSIDLEKKAFASLQYPSLRDKNMNISLLGSYVVVVRLRMCQPPFYFQKMF